MPHADMYTAVLRQHLQETKNIVVVVQRLPHPHEHHGGHPDTIVRLSLLDLREHLAGQQVAHKAPMPVAQKEQPIRHPTWVERHWDQPCLYSISTDSTVSPSGKPYRYFTVLSKEDTSFFSILTQGIVKVCDNFSRRACGRLDICAKSDTPLSSQS